MSSRFLSLLVILPSFALGLVAISGALAPPPGHSCGTAQAAGLMVWLIAAGASVFAPGLLSVVRSLRGASTDDLRRIAGLAFVGHAALVAVGCARFVLFG